MAATILGIDDLKENLDVLCAVIRKHLPDCHVITASSGKEGIAAAQKEQPDVILLDAKMPKMDGFEVCKRLKVDPTTRHIPVLMVSAVMTGTKHRVSGLESGADGYVCKPYETEELIAQIKALLRVKRSEDQLREHEHELEALLASRTGQLYESEQQFRLLFEHNPIGMVLCNLDYQFTEANRTFCQMLGYEREELLGRSFLDITHPDDLAASKELALPLATGKIPSFKIEKRYLTNEGTIIWGEVTATVINAPDDRPSYIVGMIENITERKLAEIKLRSTEERFSRLTEKVHVIPWQADASERKFAYVGPQAQDIVGYPMEEWYEDGFWESHIHPEDREQALAFARASADKHSNYEFEYRMIAPDGRSIWIYDIVNVERNEKGPTVLRGYMVDVTERRQAEENLKQVLSGVRCLLWYANVIQHDNGDLVWDIHVSNEEAAQQFLPLEMKPGESYTDAWISSKDPSHVTHSDWVSAEAIRSGMRRYNQVYRVTQADGDHRWLYEDVHIEPIGNARYRGIGVCTDITGRKRAEEEKETLSIVSKIFLAADSLEPIFDELPAILATHFDYPIVTVELYDADTNSMRYAGTNGVADDNVLEESVDVNDTLAGEVIMTGLPFVEKDITKHPKFDRNRLKDNKIKTYICVPMKIGERVLGAIVLADHTERKVEPAFVDTIQVIANYCAQAIESKHAESELRITQFALDNSGDAAFWVEADSSIRYANQEACKRLEYTKQELLAMKLHEIDPETSEDDWPHVWKRIKEEKVLTLETVQLAKGGHEFPVEITFTHVVMENNEFGFAIARDISERRETQAALMHSEEQLRQSQKMEAVGRLAGGIAHDFNNLLTSILGFSRLIMDSVGDDAKIRNDLEEIVRAGERAAKLTKQLLTFSRKQMIQVMPIDVNCVVMEIDQLLRRTLGEDVELVTLLGDNLSNVEADAGLLEQVIMNLAVNARDAMPKGGKLIIQTSSKLLDERFCKDRGEQKPGEYVVLQVKDNGCGMPQEVREHAFEPFFTTKEKGKGTGLGLSTVYGIAQQLGGFIECDSEIGQGTTVTIYMPTTERPALFESRSEKKLPKGEETILLVEDEDTVRRLTARILESLGYEVLQARNGSEALLVCEEYDETINLVLTDVVMPHMGGDELVDHLAQIRPQLKIIYTSGFTDHALTERGIGEHSIPLILKPYTREGLARTVRNVLDNGQG